MATGSCGITISASPPKLVTKRGNPPSRQQQRGGGRRRITSQLELRPPPYPLDGLEPYMSRRTVELHWGRHCRVHLDTLNRLIAGTELDSIHDLHQILLLASSSSSYSHNKNDSANATFNHAAHLWIHDFFWQSMTTPQRGSPPPSPLLLHLICRDFGSFDSMLRQFNTAASTHFGSGWVWLLYKANRLNVPNAVNPCPSEEDNKLVITTTPNAVNPLLWDYSPLLAVDVWEHAYYLDYENRRADYVSNFMEKLVSWEVVSSRLESAVAQAKDRMREDETRKEEDDKEMAGSEAVEMYLDRDNND